MFVSLSISPGNPTLVLSSGTAVQLHATDRFSDGSARDRTDVVAWSSSDASVIAVSDAAATKGAAVAGSSAGTATVTARDEATGGTATITVVVTEAVATGLVVTPAASSTPAGYGVQLAAWATYSDTGLESIEVTELVEWTSSSDGVATVSNDPVTRGLATGRAQGEATITASLPGSAVSGSARLTVTPAVLQSIAISAPATDLPKGVPVQLTATGTFSDGTSQDVTGFVTWAVSPAGVAQVSGGDGSAGVVTGLQEGSATVTATDGAVTSSITLRFTPARLLSLTVSATPSRGFTWAGTTTRFSAHGAFDDGSTLDLTRDVTWSVSPETVATFSSIPGKENQLWAFTGTTEQVTVAATEATSGLSNSFTWSRIRSRSR